MITRSQRPAREAIPVLCLLWSCFLPQASQRKAHKSGTTFEAACFSPVVYRKNRPTFGGGISVHEFAPLVPARGTPRRSRRGDPVARATVCGSWIPSISAFTRVFAALCAGMSGGECNHVALVPAKAGERALSPHHQAWKWCVGPWPEPILMRFAAASAAVT